MSVKTNSLISSQNLNSLDGEWNNLAQKFAPVLSRPNSFHQSMRRKLKWGDLFSFNKSAGVCN
jgi:hypothetical protein